MMTRSALSGTVASAGAARDVWVTVSGRPVADQASTSVSAGPRCTPGLPPMGCRRDGHAVVDDDRVIG